MLLTAAQAAFADGDLQRAYSLAGLAIRASEEAIAALDNVKLAEDEVDKAFAKARALPH
jgi:hypothetical protein